MTRCLVPKLIVSLFPALALRIHKVVNILRHLLRLRLFIRLSHLLVFNQLRAKLLAFNLVLALIPPPSSATQNQVQTEELVPPTSNSKNKRKATEEIEDEEEVVEGPSLAKKLKLNDSTAAGEADAPPPSPVNPVGES